MTPYRPELSVWPSLPKVTKSLQKRKFATAIPWILCRTPNRTFSLLTRLPIVFLPLYRHCTCPTAMSPALGSLIASVRAFTLLCADPLGNSVLKSLLIAQLTALLCILGGQSCCFGLYVAASGISQPAISLMVQYVMLLIAFLERGCYQY